MSNFDYTNLHLVIRFSEMFNRAEDTIESHNKVADKYGSVLFGKMGNKLALLKIEALNEAVSRGNKRFLYLVKTKNRRLIVYKAPIIKVFRDLPSTEKQLIPEYYYHYNLLVHIHSWIKISKISLVDNKDLANLMVVGSAYSLDETLGRSSTGHFWVREKVTTVNL